MGRAFDQEELFALRIHGLFKGRVRHVFCIGNVARHHE